MNLDRSQLNQIKSWLSERSLFPLCCPLCGGTVWDDFLTAAPVLGGGAGRSVELACGQCAYQMLFDAQLIGLAPTPPPSDMYAEP